MGSLIPFKLFATVFLAAVGIFAVLMVYWGLLDWQKTDTACLGGNRWHQTVERQQWLSLGPLHLYYVPMSWSCPEDRSYDPSRYRVVNGLLEAR